MRKGSRGSNPSASEPYRLGGTSQDSTTLRQVGVAASQARRWRRRAVLIGAALGVWFVCPTSVDAQQPDAKTTCLSAYESAQVLRQQAHLVEAREALGICARQECPPLVRQDCGNWFEELEKAIPSVIVQATVDNAETTNVKVSVDGKVVKTRLDGKAIIADPGSHKFRFETPGFPPIETTVTVREGEHYRPIAAEFLTHKTPPPPVEMTRPVPSVVWILGGVAVVGAAGFTTFGLIGNSKKSSLEKSGCQPFCSTSDVDTAMRNYQIADISLAVGVVALVSGSIFFLTRPEVPVQVGIAPSSSGIALSATGKF
jgi:hypothetical protein